MPAIRERWFADDYELTEGDIRDVELREGTMGTPQMRGANATIANRTGQLWRPKVHEGGSFTLNVWLGTYQRQAQELWDEVLRAVVQPHRLVTWRRITAGGEARYCAGEVVGALAPTFLGQSAYRAAIEVQVPAGYWRGEQQLTVSSPAAGAAGSRDLDLGVFSPSTAPLQEFVIRLRGGLENPVLSDTTARGRGDALSYAGTIPDGAYLELDCGTWTVTPSPGWTGYNPAALNYTGDRFLALAATPPGVVHKLRLTTSSPMTGGVDVTGYRSYLV